MNVEFLVGVWVLLCFVKVFLMFCIVRWWGVLVIVFVCFLWFWLDMVVVVGIGRGL